jgi:RNA polymerase sigma-70 factor, ECF subfamily
VTGIAEQTRRARNDPPALVFLAGRVNHVADAKLLFSQHRDGVFRYISRIVGQADTADELTQEVFLRAWRAPLAGETEVEGRAWVFKVARNIALNHLRDARRRPQTVELTDAAQPATQELSVALQQALAALPDLDRDVFLMRETAGLSYDEIASACDVTVDAVRSRLHRARLQLREALGRQVAERRAGGVRIGRRQPEGSDD